MIAKDDVVVFDPALNGKVKIFAGTPVPAHLHEQYKKAVKGSDDEPSPSKTAPAKPQRTVEK